MSRFIEETHLISVAGRNLLHLRPAPGRKMLAAGSHTKAGSARENRPFVICDFLFAGSKPPFAPGATAQIAQVRDENNARSFKKNRPSTQIERPNSVASAPSAAHRKIALRRNPRSHVERWALAAKAGLRAAVKSLEFRRFRWPCRGVNLAR